MNNDEMSGTGFWNVDRMTNEEVMTKACDLACHLCSVFERIRREMQDHVSHRISSKEFRTVGGQGV